LFFGGLHVAAVLDDDDVAVVRLEVGFWCRHGYLIFWNE
jgi:hypothetical protein